MIPLMMQENYKPQGWRKSHRLLVLRCVCTLGYDFVTNPAGFSKIL